MDGRTLIDEFYALANGTLAPDEARRLRERVAADPRLRAFLEDYLEVHALTEPGREAVPPCRLEFAEVESALDTQRAWRGVLRRSVRIAAAVLVLVVGGLLLSRVVTEEAGPGEKAVVLRAIPLSVEEVSPPPAGTPEMLASYRPVEDGEIRWIESFDAARAVARLSSRPVFLYIHHPTCPYCLKMNDETFTHADVVDRIADFVPARVNVMSLPRELAPLLRGWPWLGIVRPDAEPILSFPGLKGPGELVGHLEEARRRAGPPAASWDHVRAVAGRLAAGAEAEREGALGRAFEIYSELAGAEDAGPFRAEGTAGVSRIGQHALATILTARDLSTSPSGVDAALATLEAESARLAGTPLAEELDRVAGALRRQRAFPAIPGLPAAGR